MRFVGASLNTHYQGTELTLATCVKITQRDGTILALTDCDQNLTVAAVTYLSAVGYELSSLRTSARIEDDTTVIEGLLVAAFGVKEVSLLIGLLTGAIIEIFEVNWADLTQGTRPLKYGRISRASAKGAFFSLEIEGLASKLLRNEVLETYAPECPADYGDARCTAVVASYAGTITVIANSSTVTAAAFAWPGTVGFFEFGKIVFNQISWMPNRIKAYNAGTKTFTLDMPLPLLSALPAIGGTFTAYQGCDKKAATCKAFGNMVNFQGFQFVPVGALKKYQTIVPGGYPTGS